MTFSRLLRSLTSLALAATLAVALVTPAGAQHYTRGGGGYQRGYSSHYGWHGGHPYGGYGYHGYPGAYVGGALLGLGLGALLGGALLAPPPIVYAPPPTYYYYRYGPPPYYAYPYAPPPPAYYGN